MSDGAGGNERGGDRRVTFLYAGQDSSHAPRDVTSVRVDPSVKTIRERAFEDCRQLVEVELPDGLERIEDGAFRRCKSLAFIEIPSSVKSIGAQSFFLCTRLEGAELRAGMKEIGDEAFMHCTSMKHVAIPSTVRGIGARAFYACKQLTGVLDFCEGLEHIGQAAFYDCKHLKRVKIPSTVEVIDTQTFFGCGRLERVTLCEGLLQIRKYAFFRCERLKSIEVPSTARLIDRWAFQDCHHLEDVELREGVVWIDDYAFHHCKSLQHVILPSTVKMIGSGAFAGCDRLERLELCEGIERIKESSFWNCMSLTRIKIPSTAILIDKLAFHSCRQLLTVELGEGVDNLAASTFRGCPLLRNLAIPESAPTVCSFEGCRDLLKLFGSPRTIDEALKSRFVALPIHELCYHQSHHSTEVAVEQLETAGSATDGAEESIDMINTIRNGQDCLGMTPLHILACSSKQNLNLYRIVVDYHPDSLITEDKWGCLPILYAIWGNAPQEIIQFLVDSQKSSFPNSELNWDRMILDTCRAGASIETVHLLLEIHQSSFSKQSMNWGKTARELATHCLVRSDSFGDYSLNWGTMMEVIRTSQAHCECVRSLQEIQLTFFHGKNSTNWRAMCEDFVAPLKGWWRPGCPEVSLKTFQFLITHSISERIDAVGVKKWRKDIRFLVERIRYFAISFVTAQFDIIHSRLVSVEHEYRQLEDATSLLELALWKSAIDEPSPAQRDNEGLGNRSHNREIIGGSIPRSDQIDRCGDVASKRRCRLHCGANIVIPNVLPFLIGE